MQTPGVEGVEVAATRVSFVDEAADLGQIVSVVTSPTGCLVAITNHRLQLLLLDLTGAFCVAETEPRGQWMVFGARHGVTGLSGLFKV